MSPAGYPLSVRARFDQPSRWLWLVKWLLLIPHYVILLFLWPAFVIVTVIAFFAILLTMRYPRGLFDFNVGVLRWPAIHSRGCPGLPGAAGRWLPPTFGLGRCLPGGRAG